MTAGQLLKIAYKTLEKAQTPNYQLDAQYLLAWVIKQDRAHLLAFLEQEISAAQTKKYQTLISRRARHWPVAYLVGRQEFYGLDFKVNPDVLIPRPETEIMVDKIIAEAEEIKDKTAIIDIGCGSGAIIVSLAKNIKKKNFDYYGLDISPAALTVAKQNSKLNKINKKIKFRTSDLLSALTPALIKNYKKIIMAANLPYLTAKQIKQEISIKHEPRLALLSGPDGLNHYRRLLKQITTIKNVSLIIHLEIEPEQKLALQTLAQKYWPQAKIETQLDYCARPRIMTIAI